VTVPPRRLPAIDSLTRAHGLISAGVHFCDLTLRDGEQAANVAFGTDEKVLIARALEDLGVDQVQVGFAAQDSPTVAIMKDAGVNVPLELVCPAFTPSWRRDLNMAVDAGVDSVQVIMRTTDRHLQAMHLTRAQAIRRTVGSIEFARSRGAKVVVFGPSFASQADLSFLSQICRAAVDAGAELVSIADSLGICSPAAFKQLIEEIVTEVAVPIGVHCHNDFGLATACTLAGLEAGATWADVTVGGVGERAGNASLEQVATALIHLYGSETKLKTQHFQHTAQTVARILRRPVAENAPVIGDAVFAQKLDIHVWTGQHEPELFEPYDPALVGNHRWIALGKGSGPYAVTARLKELGLSADEAQVERLVAWVNEYAIREKRCVSEAELRDAWNSAQLDV
jgi:isopropylmalate/homocitrate/citramalate synthase